MGRRGNTFVNNGLAISRVGEEKKDSVSVIINRNKDLPKNIVVSTRVGKTTVLVKYVPESHATFNGTPKPKDIIDTYSSIEWEGVDSLSEFVQDKLSLKDKRPKQAWKQIK